jgi:hypothetical protein
VGATLRPLPSRRGHGDLRETRRFHSRHLATSGLPPQPSTIAVAPSITLTASAEQQLDGVAGVANCDERRTVRNSPPRDPSGGPLRPASILKCDHGASCAHNPSFLANIEFGHDGRMRGCRGAHVAGIADEFVAERLVVDFNGAETSV